MAVTQLTEEIVLAALGTVKDPELHRGMIELKMIQDVALVDPRTVAMRVVLTTPACPLKNKIHDDIDAALATLPGAPKAEIKWDAQVSRTGSIPQMQQIEGVKNIVSVGAGKGGVGKSTSAVNLALALAQLGARTGVLDADVYGPNVPILLGAEREKPYAQNDKIIPIQRYGIKLISIRSSSRLTSRPSGAGPCSPAPSDNSCSTSTGVSWIIWSSICHPELATCS